MDIVDIFTYEYIKYLIFIFMPVERGEGRVTKEVDILLHFTQNNVKKTVRLKLKIHVKVDIQLNKPDIQ
ncbi:hypothetical protein ATCV1_Z366L [Acanthocystis turfacea chlorella virus 1]|uniref:Uncharacterized protein Z366L n=1 Tax=Chlorovirus heliozoae TaxID=322019 RepID=A7K8X6_9PHYC|nr:hypothetical protein ATCV1_Z366L [Acanthocystis turfacea chlorella virus 1]ABT16500.1 hypothetical protein ATCV1_Z366L [Acanthocystis turfacea chlorella virus 1]